MEKKQIVHYPLLRVVTPGHWEGRGLNRLPNHDSTHYEAAVFNIGNPRIYSAFANQPIEELFRIIYEFQSEWRPDPSTPLEVISNSEDHKSRLPTRGPYLGRREDVNSEDLEKFREFIESLNTGTYVPHK